MRLLILILCLLSSNLFAADLLPESSGVSAMFASFDNCHQNSDCKTDLASAKQKLESKGFIILKTQECTVVPNTFCSDGRPNETGSVSFAR